MQGEPGRADRDKAAKAKTQKYRIVAVSIASLRYSSYGVVSA